MANIKVLDKLIANMIAAGEVVERPSSVVKELFENSLDAKAERITVEITDGGQTMIKVSDNGCGMDSDDASMCLVRYATSKLQDADGLYSIKTMGFRGEALASICAVSRVTVVTKKEDITFGTKIVCEGGEIIENSETGCQNGTSITVENLFYNTPARLKFMKKPATEGSYIEELVGKLILANPHISVRFIKDGKEVFYSKGDGDLKSAVYTVYGRAVLENLIFVDYEREGIRITGYIGNPNLAKPSLKYENFSVNGRICRTKTMVSALESGYFQKIAQGKHPFCALNIGIDYSLCDVNMHPQKAEVKFSDEGLVYQVLSEAVRNALNDNLYIRKTEDVKIGKPEYKAEIKKHEETNLFSSVEKPSPKTIEKYKNAVFSTPFKEANEYIFFKETDDFFVSEKPSFKEKTTAAEKIIPKKPEIKEEEKAEIPPYKIAGQIFKTYIIIETDDEMLLLDQHAAHERMNYEMLRENSEKEKMSQLLLVPKTIRLSPVEYRTVMENTELFSRLGFEIEDFNDNTVVVRSVPTNVPFKNAEKLIYEVVDELSKSGNIKNEDFNQRILYMIACKMSIKANMKLTPMEAEELVKKAFLLKGNTTCPHGRPLFISFSKSFIEGKFER